MKNLDESRNLREPLQSLLDSASRANTLKPQRYWYPLSIATYGVEEVLAAVDSLCSFRTSMWEKTAEFERQFAPTHGCTHGVMVNSGSSADLLIAFALRDPRIGLLAEGDEVLAPAVTWPTQVWSLMMAGLRPVLVDTDPHTLNMDLRDAENKMSNRTRAIWPVHLMGNANDMHAVQRLADARDLIIVEDCCEAFGARFDDAPVGAFGVASSFSFFFSHHLTTMEGGMVCCRDDMLSDVLRMLRAHGWARDTQFIDYTSADGIDPRYTFLGWGFNLRPTGLQAAFGLEQLRRASEFHDRRVANAEYLLKGLSNHTQFLRPMQVDARAECSWFAFPLVVTGAAPFSRTELVAHLEAAGIETRPILAGSLARHPVKDQFPELQVEDLAGADEIHDRGFYVGIHPFEVRDKLDRVLTIFDDFLSRQG